MSQPEESFRDLSERGYPTKDEVEAVWFKLIVQPALLEEVRRAKRPTHDEAARVRQAIQLARAAKAEPPPRPAGRMSWWERAMRLLGWRSET